MEKKLKLEDVPTYLQSELSNEIVGDMMACRLTTLREQGKSIEEQYSDPEVKKLAQERKLTYDIRNQDIIRKAIEIYGPYLKSKYENE